MRALASKPTVKIKLVNQARSAPGFLFSMTELEIKIADGLWMAAAERTKQCKIWNHIGAARVRIVACCGLANEAQ